MAERVDAALPPGCRRRQVEQHRARRRRRGGHRHHRSGDVFARQPRLGGGQIGRCRHIAFAQQNEIGLAQLPVDGVAHERVVGARPHGLAVGQDQHAIHPIGRQQVDRGGDGAGHGDAAGLDQHAFGQRAELAQIHQRRHQVATETTADAAAGEADQIILAGDDQVVIDGQGAKLVDHNRQAQTIGGPQQVIDQGGFAGAQIAADDGGGDGARPWSASSPKSRRR